MIQRLTASLAAIFLISLTTSLTAQNPSDLRLLYRSTYGPALTVAAHENWLYVGTGAAVRIYDVTEPRAPIEKGHVFVADVITDLKVRWPFLFVAAGRDGVTIINVSMPETPEVIARIDSLETSFRLSVSDSLLFVTARNKGTSIFAISKIAQPGFLANIPVISNDANAYEAVHTNNRLIIAEGKGGWRVFDLSFPNKPAQLASVSMAGSVESVAVQDSTVFLGHAGYLLREGPGVSS